MLLLLACADLDGRKLPSGDDTADTAGADSAGDDSGGGDSGGGDSGGGDSGGGDSGGGDSGEDTGADTGTVDGLPVGRLTIGFWCGPPASELTAARVAEIAAAGFTRLSVACDSSTYTPEYNLTMLALAEAAGLDATVTDSRGLAAAAGSDVAGNVAALAAEYGGSPALRAYHVYDEPSAAVFGALASVVDAMAAVDPAHFVSVNLFPDYASTGQLGTHSYDAYVASFLDTVGPAEFTYDHYNFLSDGTDGATFFQNLASVRAAADARGVPFGQYIQAISYTGHRATTGPEKRWAAMHTLAYGGAGVYYFTYWTPPQTAEAFGDGIIGASGAATAQYADVAAINADLAAIGRYLVRATSTDVYLHGELAAGTRARSPGDLVYVPSVAPLTVGTFTVGSGAYALVVNRDYRAAVDTDLYVGTADGRVDALDVGTGRFAAMATTADGVGTRVHVTLDPGDATLLHLPSPAAGPTGAEAFFGSVRADAGALDIVDSRYGTMRIAAAGWDTCPAGTTLMGHDFQSNGFWLCAPDAYAGRTWYVGNVVSDAGTLYRVAGGTATALGGGGWGECPGGALLGMRFDSNGYWVCME